MLHTRDLLHATLLLTGAILSRCQADQFEQLCTVKDERVHESSGLAVSHTCPDAVWLHNDSGDKPRLFLVGLDGETRAVVTVAEADAVDWEDMCSFRIGDQSWLLIGDVGDNEHRRGDKQPSCRLYLLKERDVPPGDPIQELSWPIAATIKLKYEDGPWNCEGVAVDVERREILLLTKTAPQKCGLYVLPLDLNAKTQKHTAKRIAAPFIPYATALDISPTGRTMVICSMLNGIVIRRSAGASWGDSFDSAGMPISLPRRRQGETICFDETGQSVYANSEKSQQPLWRVRLPD